MNRTKVMRLRPPQTDESDCERRVSVYDVIMIGAELPKCWIEWRKGKRIPFGPRSFDCGEPKRVWVWVPELKVSGSIEMDTVSLVSQLLYESVDTDADPVKDWQRTV